LQSCSSKLSNASDIQFNQSRTLFDEPHLFFHRSSLLSENQRSAEPCLPVT
jgi:hypothetical protein